MSGELPRTLYIYMHHTLQIILVTLVLDTSRSSNISTHISILHPHRDHWSQDIQGLPHDAASLESVGLQQTVEHLQHDALVDGKPGNDVGKQQVTMVLGSRVLGAEERLEDKGQRSIYRSILVITLYVLYMNVDDNKMTTITSVYNYDNRDDDQ